MAYQTIIESVKNYICQCPYLSESANININYLADEPYSFSIEESPKEDVNIEKTYLDGQIEKEFRFVLSCRFAYNDNSERNLENSRFLDEFQEWIEDNNIAGILPELRDGLNSVSLFVTKPGYLSEVSGSSEKAKYQIQIKLIYEKEKK